ncbi:DUF4178 domain-containing protein [Paenibacillus koleovorans]|uniref:DUF4178 domain-containing protein n=1 Tax=Paenibacillus koleovorans TaxID=121608 RepID=UPI000FDA74E3|nr:DUF4178 domain-containing protein [Paenibacillus koleovorans]
MSVWKRIGSILKSQSHKPEPAPASLLHPLEETGVGDIVTVDLEEYIVTGKVTYFDRGFAPHRFAYYLQSGRRIDCLIVEKGRAMDCYMCEFLEGSLDDPSDVPTTLVLDGETTFELEWNRKDVTRTEGRTDFRSNDEVLIWRYYANQEKHFFLQWQDGKFVAMQGNRIPAAEVKRLQAASPNAAKK